jgi:hypothetical protein
METILAASGIIFIAAMFGYVWLKGFIADRVAIEMKRQRDVQAMTERQEKGLTGQKQDNKQSL